MSLQEHDEIYAEELANAEASLAFMNRSQMEAFQQILRRDLVGKMITYKVAAQLEVLNKKLSPTPPRTEQ